MRVDEGLTTTKLDGSPIRQTASARSENVHLGERYTCEHCNKNHFWTKKISETRSYKFISNLIKDHLTQ